MTYFKGTWIFLKKPSFWFPISLKGARKDYSQRCQNSHLILMICKSKDLILKFKCYTKPFMWQQRNGNMKWFFYPFICLCMDKYPCNKLLKAYFLWLLKSAQNKLTTIWWNQLQNPFQSMKKVLMYGLSYWK